MSIEGFNLNDIIFNNKGIDTISQIANYNTVLNILDRDSIKIENDIKHTPLTPYIQTIYNQITHDTKVRYKSDNYKPIIEYCKISPGVGLSNYLIIIRNIPVLFDYASEQKKAKDTYCKLIYSGLHQPTKKISNKSIKFISKMLKRKSFKLHSLEIATDFIDHNPINYKKKDEVKKKLEKYTEPKSYIISNNTLYCNDVKDKHLSKLKIYDKYIKQNLYHKQLLHNNLGGWKRLEIEIKPQSNKMNFRDYIRSNEFRIHSLGVFNSISHSLNISGANDYLNLQVNSLLDNRIINNPHSINQYNSKASLTRFKKSGFKPIKI